MLSLKRNKLNRQPKRRLRIAVGVISICLIGYAAVAYSGWFSATQKQQYSASPNEIVTFSTDKPDEKKPDKPCTDYATKDESPIQIKIPSISIDSCIQSVGIDQDNNIAVPTNIHLAGWYTGSPLPGDPGVSIIDGHVLGRYNDAIFTDLHKLSPGESIEIISRSGKSTEYEVADATSYTVAEAAKHLAKTLPNTDSQLNLITCIGSYDNNLKTYDKRLIVRAKIVEK